MRIAIPVEDGHLHENFARCRRFTFLETDAGGNVVVRRDDVAAPDGSSGLVPPWLRKQGVKVLIAGGIGPRALGICARCDIEVRAGTRGVSIEQVIAAYSKGELMLAPAPEPRPHCYPL